MQNKEFYKKEVMPKKFYSKINHLLFGLYFSLFLLPACTKRDFFIPETATASFEIEDAKEWWYGTFKQSQRFTSFDLASDFIKMKKGQSPNYLETLTPETRFPSWKSGNIVHAGSTTFIEFNLVQQYTSIPIPVKWGEDDNDRKRIANATIQKLLIVKKKNGLIVERIVTIIPSLDYLKKNNYFNKIENILTLPGDFSGIVLVRDWNEVSKANWLYKDGKRKTLELRRKNDAELNEITTMYTPCPPYWGVIDVDRWCIDVHEGNSDEPSGYCDNPNNWHERIVEGWVYPEGDCGESGNDPCGDMGFEQCQCVTYGIGCEGGGGDGDPPPPDPDPCEDAQPVANSITALSQDGSFVNGKSAIQSQNPNFEHTVTFGKDANGNITASPVNVGSGTTNGDVNINWQGAFADLHNHPDDQVPSPGDLYGLVSINENNANYSTRIVMTISGAVYALAILDKNLARDFVLNNPKSKIGNYPPDFPDPIFTDFADAKVRAQQQQYDDITAEQMAMAFILAKYNTGMALFKQDVNGNFKKLQTKQIIVNNYITYSEINCL
jgi:hypothetical protein